MSKKIYQNCKKKKIDYFNKKEILSYKNINTSSDSVHHPFSNNGNASLYKKITLSSIFMMKPFLFSKDKKVNKDSFGYYKQLSFGGDFQQKYCYITNIQQVRRGIAPTVFNNDASSVGTFKNILHSASMLSLNSVYFKYKEASRTAAFRLRNLFLLKNLHSVGTLGYFGLIQAAKSNLFFRTHSHLQAFDNFIVFSKEISTIAVKEKLITNLVLMNKFIRTIWFRTALLHTSAENPINFFDNSGSYVKDQAHSEFFKGFNAAEVQVPTFSALGSFENSKVDVLKYLQSSRRGGIYKRHVKRYSMWRLGIVHWGKKILSFKKNYLFWKYMRGMTNYFYRGYYINSVFTCRADVFVLRNFGIKSLKFSRILVMSGHVFMGSYPIKNTKTVVLRYNIVSISKILNIYLSKKRYNKYWKKSKNFNSNKFGIRMVKSTPLKYCRQQRDLIFWGQLKNTKYSMFYGPNLGVLNNDSRRTKFFSLNYFYIQKSVASAWW